MNREASHKLTETNKTAWKLTINSKVYSASEPHTTGSIALLWNTLNWVFQYRHLILMSQSTNPTAVVICWQCHRGGGWGGFLLRELFTYEQRLGKWDQRLSLPSSPSSQAKSLWFLLHFASYQSTLMSLKTLKLATTIGRRGEVKFTNNTNRKTNVIYHNPLAWQTAALVWNILHKIVKTVDCVGDLLVPSFLAAAAMTDTSVYWGKRSALP